jgi:hypothetical protein
MDSLFKSEKGKEETLGLYNEKLKGLKIDYHYKEIKLACEKIGKKPQIKKESIKGINVSRDTQGLG